MSDVNLMAEKVTEGSHTPGPWIAASSPSSIVGWPIVGPRGRAVASVHCLRGNTPEGKAVNAEAGANARLISAAPDLLEALKDLLQRSENEGWAYSADEREAAVAAIAKAEGRS